jgi:Ser/Thr protein kinase RdoA (MazF antagonist)
MTDLVQFFSLTPESVLDAVEQSGHRTTGLCYALNSLENRVYEVEREDGIRVVAKFYRPNRWSRETILDEHRFLVACAEQEIPVCVPLTFSDGSTLHTTQSGIFFALFPRIGGRCPEELEEESLKQLGRFLGRIHRVSESLQLRHRPVLSPQTYARDYLDIILQRTNMSLGIRQRYIDAVNALATLGDKLFTGVESLVVHADFHRGNLLHHPTNGWLLLDFDDMASAPPVQDMWLILSGRPKDCPAEVDALIEGYEQFRPFEHRSLELVELLRGLRYVRYAGWIASRWDDPAFHRAFPQWGTDNYWESQLSDINEQIFLVRE